MVLKKLKEDAERYLGEWVTEAVIAVPVYFDSLQCQAIKDAAKLAGLDIKCIMNESVAAALAYDFSNNCEECKIMIYDLGGGNFNVAIIEISYGVIKVLAASGDSCLGGDDFDNRIMQWILNEVEKGGVNISNDRIAMQRIKEVAEKAKKELSHIMSTEIHVPFIANTAEGPKHFDGLLTRAKFDELTQDLVERTVVIAQKVMEDAGVTNMDLDEVLLIGGSSRIPAVREMIGLLTVKVPNMSLNPDECIAIGATIQGSKLI